MRGTRILRSALLLPLRIIPAHAGNSDAVVRTVRRWSDHPRACGELHRTRPGIQPPRGSSPRMRGTPGPSSLIFSGHTDHPRACGELPIARPGERAGLGSSPRMRGTRALAKSEFGIIRIIPAHAGNSPATSQTPGACSDHPRACGELACQIRIWDRPGGSSRACGELQHGILQPLDRVGSSPRMRGTRSRIDSHGLGLRIIPAHAGNSRSVVSFTAALTGSSPRMRGTPSNPPTGPLLARIIPAHAGNSSRSVSAAPTVPDHPRACGELRRGRRSQASWSGSSPRMRGTPRPARAASPHYRIIPAHAGNSR